MRMPGRAGAAAEPAPPQGRTGPLLTVAAVCRNFGDVPVLTGVDLRVSPGEAVAVTGPNGAGKTTLLRCVAGLDRPSSGTVELCGRPLREHEPGARRRVAAVLDDIEFFDDLSVREHLALLMCAHGDSAPDRHAGELLTEAGLAGMADRRPAALSSGQRRRLALATCFARPRVLVLLDEPEQRLDAAGRRWLTARLRAEKELGHGVLFTSHDRGLVRAVADRVVSLTRTGP